jgi:Brp/Blh family beta-carotene 15,15'-monooxygenase
MAKLGCVPGWVVLPAVLLAGGATALPGAPAVPTWVRYAPLAASLLLFGLPHGAVDHLAPARAGGARPTRHSMAAVGACYLLLGGGYAAVWAVAPVAAALLFLALTWFHWGQGDLYALDALGGGPEGRWLRAGTVVVRGGVPMVVPLLAHPERYRGVVAAWVGLFGRTFDGAWLLAPPTRAGVGLALGAVSVWTLVAGRRRGRGPWRRDAAETAFLWAYFLLVSPLFAIGAYFCLWHSPRHVARLVGVDGAARAAFVERGPLAALARTGREALPLTAVSLAGLLAVGVAAGVGTDLRTLAALYLVAVAVVTLPHVAVVTWMDRVEYAPP